MRHYLYNSLVIGLYWTLVYCSVPQTWACIAELVRLVIWGSMVHVPVWEWHHYFLSNVLNRLKPSWNVMVNVYNTTTEIYFLPIIFFHQILIFWYLHQNVRRDLWRILQEKHIFFGSQLFTVQFTNLKSNTSVQPHVYPYFHNCRKSYPAQDFFIVPSSTALPTNISIHLINILCLYLHSS